MKKDQIPLKKSHSKYTNFKFTLHRSYSMSRCYSTSSSSTPLPILTITDLHDKNNILSKRDLLSKKGGIYTFLNKMNGNQYIGSAKDLYLRLNEHLLNKKSNRALQFAIAKHGLDNFHFCVYEYFTYENKATSFKLLTDLETMYINKFNFNNLYNFSKSGSSLEGYKHT